MLIVDDDNMNLMALYSMLAGLNIQPVICNQGSLAVRYFQEKFKATCCSFKFDLILTDIQMPSMDGFKLAECVRATELTWASSIAENSMQGKLKTKN